MTDPINMADTDTGDPNGRRRDNGIPNISTEEDKHGRRGSRESLGEERGQEMDTSGSVATGDSWGSGDATDRATPGYTDMESGWDDELDSADMDTGEDLSQASVEDGYKADIGDKSQDSDDVEMFIGNPDTEDPIYMRSSTQQVICAPKPQVTPQGPIPDSNSTVGSESSTQKRKKDDLSKTKGELGNSPAETKTPKTGGLGEERCIEDATMDLEKTEWEEEVTDKRPEGEGHDITPTQTNPRLREEEESTTKDRDGNKAGYDRVRRTVNPRDLEETFNEQKQKTFEDMYKDPNEWPELQLQLDENEQFRRDGYHRQRVRNTTPGRGGGLKNREQMGGLEKYGAAGPGNKKDETTKEGATHDRNEGEDNLTDSSDNGTETSREENDVLEKEKDGNGASAMEAIPIGYANAAKGEQSRLVTHEKVKEKYETMFEATFTTSDAYPLQPQIKDDTIALQEALMDILERAREVDRKAKINTWHGSTNAPTIKKTQDIPVQHALLRKYMSHVYTDRRVRQGRNSGWRIRITTSVTAEEFLHYWNISKREFTEIDFVTLRKAPLQHTSYHAAGYFLNSSEGQITTQLTEELNKEMKCVINIEHRTAALDREASERYWREAKRAATDSVYNFDRQKLFRHAPFAQQVYVADRNSAVYAAGYLHEKYGKHTADGQYPRMPDGTRMRFIPASAYLDMTGRRRAADLFAQHIHFQSHSTYAPIPIRNPMQKFPSQNNRSMQELVLDLLCEEIDNEPYFRHLRPKYFRNFKTKEYEVSIHNEMFQPAMNILRHLKEELTKRYDAEVGEALMERDDTETEGQYETTTASFSGISLETDDRYMNGKGKFIIVGLEKVQNTQTSLQDRRRVDEDRSLNPRSTGSGMSGHTGQTVPENSTQQKEWDPGEPMSTSTSTTEWTRVESTRSKQQQPTKTGTFYKLVNPDRRENESRGSTPTRSPTGKGRLYQ